MASTSRRDGRESTTTREISIKLGQLARADGSARFSFGSKSSLASFAGPIEVRIKEELPDRATLEITHRPLEGVGATPSRALEASVSSALTPLMALQQHPRSLVQIVIQSLSSPSTSYSSTSTADVSEQGTKDTWPSSSSSSKHVGAPSFSSLSFAERASAMNAATLSILDAGSVALRAVPLAVSLAYIPEEVYVDIGDLTSEREVKLVVDPSEEEERQAKSRFVVGWAFGQGIGTNVDRGEDEGMGQGKGEAEMVWMESEGSFTRDQLELVLDQSRISAGEILGTVREQLTRHLSSRQR